MGESPDDLGASTLRQKVRRFLDDRATWKEPIFRVLHVIRDCGWNSVLFGGTLRDFMVGKGPIQPRDIDIVVEGVDLESIERKMAPFISRRTRFGGLHLEVSGWLLDVWPIGETWALKHVPGLRPSFEDLPRSTFLNVEAVAVSLWSNDHKPRRVYSAGFFEAIRSRVVEINLEPNPYPTLCVVRSLLTVARLGFAVGPRLADYVVKFGAGVSASEFESVQRSHYGYAPLDVAELKGWIDFISSQSLRAEHEALKLPVPAERQLQLWDQQHPPTPKMKGIA